MDCFEEFLSGLLREGRIVFRRSPDRGPGASEGAIDLLARAYEDDRRNVAGPAIPFDAAVAFEAGELVRQACWALVNRGERVEELEPPADDARPPRGPRSTCRPTWCCGICPRSTAGPGRSTRRTRWWRCSAGSCGNGRSRACSSDLDEGPTTPPDLAGHQGLMLLYAERFAGRPAGLAARGAGAGIRRAGAPGDGRGGAAAPGTEGRG